MYLTNQLHPQVSQLFPLSEANEAMKMNKVYGKVLLKMDWFVCFSCCLMSSRKASEVIVFEDPDLKYRQKNDKGIVVREF